MQNQAAGPAARLRVVTLNVWGLPDWIARHGERRMHAIVARLAELDVDLVALQEVWTLAWRRILVEGARGHGFAHHWTNRAAIGGSGLLLLSREPLGSVRFQRFTLCGVPEHIHHGDYFSGKGFAIARVATAAGDVLLLDTHLQAGYTPGLDDEHRGLRVGELVEIAAALSVVTAPVIALGDFNVRGSDRAYRVMTGLTGLRDAAAELGHEQDTVLAENSYRVRGAGHFGPERIDYVLARDGRSLAVRPISIQRVFDEPLVFDGERAAYSDHAGLFAELAIEPTAPSAIPEPDPAAVERAEQLLREGRAIALERRLHRRELAAGGVAAAAASAGGLFALRGDRRRFLRAALWAGSLLGLSVAGLAGMLSERFVRLELAGYDHCEAVLSKLVADARAREALAAGEVPRP